jgi:hypothetical protein
MKDPVISLREIADKQYYYDNEFDKNAFETFNKHDPGKFSQVIRIFGNSHLINITAGECDYAFNTLFRDTNLYKYRPDIWCVFAEYLCDTIQCITTGVSINKGDYRKEYAGFMNEREKYRNTHGGTKKYLSIYNKNVIDWRFGK